MDDYLKKQRKAEEEAVKAQYYPPSVGSENNLDAPPAAAGYNMPQAVAPTGYAMQQPAQVPGGYAMPQPG